MEEKKAESKRRECVCLKQEDERTVCVMRIKMVLEEFSAKKTDDQGRESCEDFESTIGKNGRNSSLLL